MPSLKNSLSEKCEKYLNTHPAGKSNDLHIPSEIDKTQMNPRITVVSDLVKGKGY